MADEATLIHDAWVSFAKAVLPRDCIPIQRKEMRRAFYAGAGAMLLLAKTAGEQRTEAEGVALLESCEREVRAFIALARADGDE